MKEACPKETVLSIDGLCFDYRYSSKSSSETGTLENVSFNLYRGETLGIIGRNGAGKSTLLRLMAGIFSPSSGSIKSPANVRCSLLSLGVGFLTDLTGKDNVTMSLTLQGFAATEIRSKLPEIEEFAELGKAFNERVYTYSSGMRSRLAFSTALHARADVLLVDEVLAVGDGGFRKKAGKALRRRVKSDQTAVLVSHSEEAVRQLCTRAVWMDSGKVRMCGPAELVLDAYEAQAF